MYNGDEGADCTRVRERQHGREHDGRNRDAPLKIAKIVNYSDIAFEAERRGHIGIDTGAFISVVRFNNPRIDLEVIKRSVFGSMHDMVEQIADEFYSRGLDTYRIRKPYNGREDGSASYLEEHVLSEARSFIFKMKNDPELIGKRAYFIYYTSTANLTQESAPHIFAAVRECVSENIGFIIKIIFDEVSPEIEALVGQSNGLFGIGDLAHLQNIILD